MSAFCGTAHSKGVSIDTREMSGAIEKKDDADFNTENTESTNDTETEQEDRR
jgi:hypothetical protein